MEEKKDVRDESKREREGLCNLRNPLGRQIKEGKLEKMGSAVLRLDGFDTLRLGFSGFGGMRETTPSSLKPPNFDYNTLRRYNKTLNHLKRIFKT